MNSPEPLPDDLAAAHAMLHAERAARQAAEARLAERDGAIARQADEVAALRLEIERSRGKGPGSQAGAERILTRSGR